MHFAKMPCRLIFTFMRKASMESDWAAARMAVGVATRGRATAFSGLKSGAGPNPNDGWRSTKEIRISKWRTKAAEQGLRTPRISGFVLLSDFVIRHLAL